MAGLGLVQSPGFCCSDLNWFNAPCPVAPPFFSNASSFFVPRGEPSGRVLFLARRDPPTGMTPQLRGTQARGNNNVSPVKPNTDGLSHFASPNAPTGHTINPRRTPVTLPSGTSLLLIGTVTSDLGIQAGLLASHSANSQTRRELVTHPGSGTRQPLWGTFPWAKAGRTPRLCVSARVKWFRQLDYFANA